MEVLDFANGKWLIIKYTLGIFKHEELNFEGDVKVTFKHQMFNRINYEKLLLES